MLANRKMMDSAYIRATQPKRAGDANFVLNEARDFLIEAAAQGWDGDIDATMSTYLASPDCDFSLVAR
jgi:hypothetical protein